MRGTRSRAAGALAALLWAAPSAAKPTGADFLKISPSPRSYALGRSHGITSLGAQALGANPANLGLMPQRTELFTSFATLMDGTKYEHVASAFDPDLGTIDAIGFGVTRLHTDAIDGADANGEANGQTFGASDLALQLAASLSVTDALRAGAGVKAIQSQIAQYRSNTALAADAGLTYTATVWERPVSLGASVTNVGQGIRFISQTDPLPTQLNAGVAMPFERALVVFELNRLVEDRRTQAGVGFEYALGPAAFRVGYLASTESGDLARKDEKGGAALGGLSAGVGLRAGPLRFDYAMSQQAADYGPTQRVSLSLRWGKRIARGDTGREWGNDRSEWLVRAMERR